MPQPTLYLAITNHGFGHATRSAAIAAEIQRLCPEVVLILATTAPRWLLEESISGNFIHRPRAFDIGVVQSDSFTMDKPATLVKLRELRAKQQSLIASEASFLKQNQVDLVLADIPPLAAPIAHAAGIPCWMMSNFGWDLIYRAWGGEFIEMADWIAECFGQCDRLFRMPLHEPMAAFSSITDVGFTGGTPRFSASEIEAKLTFTAPPEKRAILTFGGLGLNQVPYHNVQQFPDWQFFTFDYDVPGDIPNLIHLTDRSLRPVDLMPFCHLIVSKPGYSTFSEACCQGISLITTTREDFAEAPILIEAIQHYLPHRIISPQDLYSRHWEFLHQPLQPATDNQPIDKGGNRAIATAVVDYLQST